MSADHDLREVLKFFRSSDLRINLSAGDLVQSLAGESKIPHAVA